MTSTTITTGNTRTTRLDMSGNDDLTVDSGGAISVNANNQSVRFTGVANGAVITNNGLIENTAGSGRAIRFEAAVTLATIANTGTIHSADDAIQMSVTSSSGALNITNNGGPIQSDNGQAPHLPNRTDTIPATRIKSP